MFTGYRTYLIAAALAVATGAHALGWIDGATYQAIAGLLGFSGIAAGAAGIAKLLFVLCLVVFLVLVALAVIGVGLLVLLDNLRQAHPGARIAAYDHRGPAINAMIRLNPNARKEAGGILLDHITARRF